MFLRTAHQEREADKALTTHRDIHQDFIEFSEMYTAARKYSIAFDNPKEQFFKLFRSTVRTDFVFEISKWKTSPRTINKTMPWFLYSIICCSGGHVRRLRVSVLTRDAWRRGGGWILRFSDGLCGIVNGNLNLDSFLWFLVIVASWTKGELRHMSCGHRVRCYPCPHVGVE